MANYDVRVIRLMAENMKKKYDYYSWDALTRMAEDFYDACKDAEVEVMDEMIQGE